MRHALQRFLPAVRPSGACWSAFQLLPPGPRGRLLRYERLARQRGVHWSRSLIFDLGQDLRVHVCACVWGAGFFLSLFYLEIVCFSCLHQNIHIYICTKQKEPSFSGISSAGLMPCLLRRASRLWSSKLRRTLLATEALEVQGLGPMYEASACGPDESANLVTGVSVTRPQFYNAAVTGVFSESQLRSLSGNAIPVYMIGAALLMVLGVTESAAKQRDDTE